jgi:hypothetical protein
MIDRNYLANHAAALLKLAYAVENPNIAAALVAKAADVKTRIDEAEYPDVSPHAPGVEPRNHKL